MSRVEKVVAGARDSSANPRPARLSHYCARDPRRSAGSADRVEHRFDAAADRQQRVVGVRRARQHQADRRLAARMAGQRQRAGCRGS